MQIVQKFITRNYTPGRSFSDGNAINTIVVHTYGGAGTSLYNWFQTNTRGVSSHFAVWKNGTIEQYVRDQDTAHANGHSWYNAHALSIEFQDDNQPADAIRTPQLYESGAQLIFTLALRYGIPLTRERIKGHNEVLAEIGGSRFCPGGLDINKLLIRARQLMQEYEELKAKVEQLQRENLSLQEHMSGDDQALLRQYREEIDSKALALSSLQVKSDALQAEIDRLHDFKSSRFYQLYLLFKGSSN